MNISEGGEISTTVERQAKGTDTRNEAEGSGGGGGGLSLGTPKSHNKSSGGLSPMAQATIEKHLSGASKRILLTQTMNKKSQSREAGTITGN